MYSIKFFFTESASFKATNVVEINVDREQGIFTYVQEATNADRTIAGHNLRSIDMDDLLYAVVKEKADGEVTIIAGLYDSFEVVPVGPAVQRQKNIEAEAARVAAYRAEKAPEREAKEAAKYVARRAARKAQYVAPTTTGSDNAADAEAEYHGMLVEDRSQHTVAPQTVTEELVAAGLDQNSLDVLKSLDILK